MKKTLPYFFLLMPFFGNAQPIVSIAASNPAIKFHSPGGLIAFKNKLVGSMTLVTQGSALERYLYTCDANDKLTQVSTAPGGAATYVTDHMKRIAEVNGMLYYTHALQGVSHATLAAWDGINTPQSVGLPSDVKNPNWFTPLSNKLYFINDEVSLSYGLVGKEVAVYDPANGTFQKLPAFGVNYRAMHAYNGKLYVSAETASSSFGGLFEYDPSTNMATIVPGSNTDFGKPEMLITLNNNLYFIASTPANTRAIFEYNGSGKPKPVSGTLTIGYPNVQWPRFAGFYNGEMYFTAGYSELYRYHPGTGNLTHVYSYKTNQGPKDFIVHKNKLYFTAGDNTHGGELWVIDGNNPPQMVFDLRSGTANANPCFAVEYNGTLYFSASDDPNGPWSLFRLAGALSVAELANEVQDLTIYPNPSIDKATLTFSLANAAKLQVSIVDMAGKEIYKTAPISYQSGKGTIDFNTSSFATGTYVYRLQDEQGKLYGTGKFVKK